MQPSEQQVHITWHDTPPSPAQLAAWEKLWTRLLGHGPSGPETPQPQDHRGPRAATVATVSSGRNLNKDTHNDSRLVPNRK